jgi:DNA-directed RNA polymerase subunit RPC12/RpoP
MNRAMPKTPLVSAGGPPKCAACGARLTFSTDTQGRTMEQCGCGYRAYMSLRTGSALPLGTTSTSPAA